MSGHRARTPSPRPWGRGGVGGREVARSMTPTPDPSPQGGGEKNSRRPHSRFSWMNGRADPSRSGALTQPGQNLESGIAVGGRNANFSLKIPYCTLGVATDPAITAVGVKAERSEAALQF